VLLKWNINRGDKALDRNPIALRVVF
jgi:hypothetical protein